VTVACWSATCLPVITKSVVDRQPDVYSFAAALKARVEAT
jgi:hypothetical protein